ncbi:DNA-binding response regulator [Roseburia inulinivorans]|jgi:DNA-binding LytR/AlgR family response regulator|uniref:Stage 0 sporulation protein A homolog n=1 Tax=Roseburia inulinivorans TaxID=360807 RepID=A0A3R6D6P5_9FIRM|nr:LytTR family DNA-binding domain-containing protein [Roseburia inulinivorans]RHF83444.1 DNA-binding response regulator [Roseburia inulinivorans]
MIKIAFCDDDMEVLHQINELLDRYRVERNEDITYAAFQSPFELLTEIEKGIRPDILFLDVVMPGQNGMDVAKEIRQYDTNMKIIFLTSSPEFAVESYSVGAYFYQLKPIWEESFFRLMDAVLAECEKKKKNSLILRSKDGITRIDLQQLEYCEVLGRKLLFHLENGAVLESAGSLDDLAGQLMQHSNFFRPHRSFLVNMEYIQNISSRSIKMVNDAEIPIPHGKCSEIKNTYMEYAFNGEQAVL